MEKFFKLKNHGTDVRTEILAGLTTFMTMAYILAVNPGILAASGMDSGAVFTATALASAIACVLMGVIANLPFALSAGMGLNAYFSYTVVLGMGYSWQLALTAVFVEGIIFIILSLTNVREAIFNAIPTTLKIGVSVGIGLFICFIGLQNAHIAVDSATLVSMYSFSDAIKNGTFHTEGITVLLALIGLLITAFLVIRKVKGNLLIGIVVTWLLGILCQLTGLYVPDAEAGFYSLIPSGVVSAPASLAPTLFKLDFKGILSVNFLVVMFAFLFVDLFDTLGTLIGCASRANMLDKDGKLPGIRGALLADSVGTVCGACLGTSTVTTFVESSSGIAEGGRTGLTAITTGGKALAAASGKNAVCARFGGDEFAAAMVLPAAETALWYKQFREKFYAFLDDFNAHSGKPYQVKASVGFASHELEPDNDLESLIKEADARMYAAKTARKAARK